MIRSEALAAVKANPRSADGWYALGRLLAAQGYNDRARDCFSRAVALDPDAQKPGARVTIYPEELPAWFDAPDSDTPGSGMADGQRNA